MTKLAAGLTLWPFGDQCLLQMQEMGMNGRFGFREKHRRCFKRDCAVLAGSALSSKQLSRQLKLGEEVIYIHDMQHPDMPGQLMFRLVCLPTFD